MICNDGSIRIMDFGIAKYEGQRRLTFGGFTPAMGTPDYMAPEQVKGKRGDARTDIYAIGIMLFEMLTGRVPWEGDNPLAVMQQHLSAPLPDIASLNPSVLPPLEAIVRKCLRKNPDERYQDAGELLHDLRHWQDLDLSKFVFAPEAPVRPQSEKGLYLIIAALSAGFLLAAGAATYLYYLLNHAGH